MSWDVQFSTYTSPSKGATYQINQTTGVSCLQWVFERASVHCKAVGCAQYLTRWHQTDVTAALILATRS
jgi:hypothetical protein